MNSGHVEVSIFNRPYKLKSTPDDENYLKQLAKFVDEKMMLAYQKNPNFKPAKIAVLTALNLADELLKLKEMKAKEPAEPVKPLSPQVTNTVNDSFQENMINRKLQSLLEKLDRSISS